MEAPDVRMIFGRSGTGKTTLIAHMLDDIGGRQLIHDPAAQKAYETPGHVICNTVAEVYDLMLTGAASFRILWRGANRHEFDQVNMFAWALENVTVVWEEVDQLWPAATLPDTALLMLNQGRHRDLRVLACARRPARVNRDLTALASRIVAFRTSEPNDLKYFSDYVGRDNTRKIAELQDWHALDWSDRRTDVKKSPFV